MGKWIVSGGKDEPSGKVQIDINAELEALMAEPANATEADADGFFTAMEMRINKGWGRDRTRLVLHKAKMVGRLETKKAQREAIDGRMIWVTAYRILPRKAKEGGG